MRLAVLNLLGLLQLQLWAAGSRAQERGGRPDSAVLLARSGDLAATGWLNTSGAYAAIRLAFGDISSHELHPTESKLQLLEQGPADVNCSTANVSVVTVLSAVGNSSAVSSICSSQTQLTHLPVITFSPACLKQPVPEDRSPTDQHFCMLPSPQHLPSGVAALVSFFKWQRAALISEEDNPLLPKSEEFISELTLSGKSDEFISELTLSGVNDTRQRSVSSEQLSSDLFDRDYRIQILNLTPPLSRIVLCEALYRNLNYVWVLPGWYPHDWWMGSADSSSASACSDAELEHALSHSVLSLVQSPTERLTGLDGPRNCSNFRAWCDSSEITDCEYAGYAYDAMWAVAKALNNSLTTDDDISRIIANSNFSGVSGQVVFDSEGYRQQGSFKVFQYRNATRVKVGTLSAGQEAGSKLAFRYSDGESEERVWPEGVPLDGSPELVLRYPILALVVVCYTLSTVMILFAIVCIVFNICFRKKKLIKLTSPSLNHMIAIGVIMMNIGVFMTVHPPIHERTLGIFCKVRSWLLAIGWSLCLSTIAVKMWRVYIIFSTANKLQSLEHKKLKRLLRDWHLTIFIMVLVVVDVLVLVVGTAVPAAEFTAWKVKDKEFPPTRNEEGIRVEYYNLQCLSEKGLIWIALILGFKIVLQVSAMVLACLARKVQVKGLNESKEVQLVMIVTTPIIVVGMIISLVLSDYLNVVAGWYSLGIVFLTGSALGIIFIPKMVKLYKNPSGDNIFLSPSHHDNIGSQNRMRLTGVESNSTSTGGLMSFDRSSTLRRIFRSTTFQKKENIAILLNENIESAERGGETETSNDHTDLPDHREPNHTVPPSLTSPVAGEQREQNKPTLQGAEDGEKVAVGD